MPRVSVIIPAYNASETILETLDSVVAQTFADIEILVINDGSSDNTAELVSNYPDPRISLINIPNGGHAHARNVGLDAAKGSILSFIDADDQWTSNKLSAQVKALTENPDANVVYSWTIYQSEQKRFAEKPFYVEGDVYERLLLSNFIASGSNIAFRAEALKHSGGFDSGLNACADWDFYLRLAQHNRYCLVPQHQIIYHNRRNSISSDFRELAQSIESVIQKNALRSTLALSKIQAVNQLNLAAVMLFKLNSLHQWQQALTLYLQTLKADPRLLVEIPLALRLPLRFLKVFVQTAGRNSGQMVPGP